MRKRTLQYILLLLLLLLPAGCASQPPQTPLVLEPEKTPLATATPVPTPPPTPAPPRSYGDASIFEEMIRTVQAPAEFDTATVRRLNKLARLVERLPCFADANMLEKELRLQTLQTFYTEQFQEDAYAYRYNQLIAYLWDGARPGRDSSRYAALSGEQANKLLQDILAVDIPDRYTAFGTPEDSIYCLDNRYYFCIEGEPAPQALSLQWAQRIGEGIYYLSFDRDGSGMHPGAQAFVSPGRDALRVIVQQADNAWGFSVVAKLKTGEESILPDALLLPAFAVEQPQAGSYEADPVNWLRRRLRNSGGGEQTLREKEMVQLNEMARLADMLPCFLVPDELPKYMLLTPLDIYGDGAFRQDWDTDEITIVQDRAYPLDGVERSEDGFGTEPYMSVKKANAFISAFFGVDIPNAEQDYGEWLQFYDDVQCKDGRYIIYEDDYTPMLYHLSHYQYVGDGMFYLAFNGDDYLWAGPEDSCDGVTPDRCRLLVRRSNSPWGFTVVATLATKYSSILPAKFPLPSQKVSYPLDWLAEELRSPQAAQEALTAAERRQLQEIQPMANMVWPRYSVEEVPNYTITAMLREYFSSSIEREGDAYRVPATLPYPITELLGDGRPEYIRLPRSTAEKLLQDVMGVRIKLDWDDTGPRREMTRQGKDLLLRYWESEEAQGVCWAASRYQHVGEGMYYVSIDRDTRENTVGYDPEYWEDYARLLVQRADTPLGFRLVSVIKRGTVNLLPEALPLPNKAF